MISRLNIRFFSVILTPRLTREEVQTVEVEDIILTCIKEQPGISAKKVVSCLDSKTSDLKGREVTNSQASIYKQLRTLKKRGNLHNNGDRWYVLKGNIG